MRQNILGLLACIMGVAATPIHAGTIIFTDNFPDSTNYSGTPTVGNFTVTAGCVDSIASGEFGFFVPSVDLDGTCEELGTITSTLPVPFSPGSTYTLSFEYSSNNDTTSAVNTSQVTLGSLINTTVTGIPNTPQTFSDTFRVGSPTDLNLSFQELGTSDNKGVVVAGISIVDDGASTSVPEPGTAGLPVLKEGTDVKLTFAQDLSSKTAAEGDTVNFVLAEDLTVGGMVVAKAGAKAVGTVSNVKKAGVMGKGGELNVRLEHLTVNGQRVRLRGNKGKSGDDKTGQAIVLTVLLGPIGLIKHGKDINVKEGTPLAAYVDEDVTIPPQR